MCYSTCSLNPIENEAVVGALLERCGGALELADGAHAIATRLAGGCAPGMHKWPVLDFALQRHEAFEALATSERPRGERRLYRASMWPPDPTTHVAQQLPKCVRLLPHRSDSGGFFVALLRKLRPLAPFPSPIWPRAHPSPRALAAPLALAPARDAHRYSRISTHLRKQLKARLRAVAASCREGGGVRGGVRGGSGGSTRLAERLFVRSAGGSRVVCLTAAAERCCAGEAGSSLHVVHAGVTVFKKRRRGAGDRTRYEYLITPEGRELIRQAAVV